MNEEDLARRKDHTITPRRKRSGSSVPMIDQAAFAGGRGLGTNARISCVPMPLQVNVRLSDRSPSLRRARFPIRLVQA
jgi:hypothetical protein